MKRKRSKLVAAVAMAVMAALSVLPATGTAWADEEVEAGVTTTVDSWQIIGNTLNLVVGPHSCTLTANSPTNSANKVYGTGSVSCTKKYALLSLQVCLQARQAFVSEESSWQNIGACEPKQALNSSYLDDQASATCIPGPAYYRTVVTAEGYNSQDSDPAFGGFIKSGKVLFNCSIA